MIVVATFAAIAATTSFPVAKDSSITDIIHGKIPTATHSQCNTALPDNATRQSRLDSTLGVQSSGHPNLKESH